MQNLVRLARAALNAETLIATLHLNIAMKRAGLGALAIFAAAMGLGLVDAAAVVQLSDSISLFWSLLVVAAADLLIAAVLVFVASRIRHEAELKLARELRDSAFEQLQTLRDNPLGSLFGGGIGGDAGRGLLLSLATTLISLLRPKKQG